MLLSVVELNCPGCGARVSTEQKTCEWCHKPIIISSFDNIYGMSVAEINKYANTYKKALGENPDNDNLKKSVAMCYLKLGLYDKAYASFNEAIEDNFEDSETYFYAAVSLLQGKKACLAKRETINKILEYVDAANALEPKGIYYYFMAYVKYDFFERKYINHSPNYRECLFLAKQNNVSESDIKMIFDILKTTKPGVFD